MLREPTWTRGLFLRLTSQLCLSSRAECRTSASSRHKSARRRHGTRRVIAVLNEAKQSETLKTRANKEMASWGRTSPYTEFVKMPVASDPTRVLPTSSKAMNLHMSTVKLICAVNMRHVQPCAHNLYDHRAHTFRKIALCSSARSVPPDTIAIISGNLHTHETQ